MRTTSSFDFADFRNIESAKVITAAKAQKASAHSRNSSILVGALLGLILGAIVAIAGEGRFSRASS